MKYLLYIFLLPLLMFTSCETTSSEDGELDNMWYLVKVDSLANGNSVDYRSKRVFWSFQGTLMQTNCVDSMNLFFMYRFENKGDMLIVKSPFQYDRVTDDKPITEQSLYRLRMYGINALTDSFMIESLHGETMILKDKKLRLSFERY